MQTFLQNLLNGIAVGAIYALIALGYTMVYGILKLINFAHGDVFMLGSFVGFYAGGWAATHLNAQGGALGWTAAGLIMLLAMVVCGAIGYLNERIAYRPLRNSPRIASLITAIGVSFLLEYGGQFVFGPDPKFFPTLVEKHLINLGGIATTNYQLIVLGVAIVFMGIMPGLKAFIAAVLGGIGNVPGAVVGGLIIGVIESFVGGSRFSNFRDAIAFVILIAILLFRPSGLFGKYQAEKV